MGVVGIFFFFFFFFFFLLLFFFFFFFFLLLFFSFFFFSSSFFFSRRIAPRTVHVLSLPLCNLFVLIPFIQDFFKKIGCLCTFLLDLGPELYFPVVASPLKLQYNESAAHRVKPQSVTVGDIGLFRVSLKRQSLQKYKSVWLSVLSGTLRHKL